MGGDEEEVVEALVKGICHVEVGHLLVEPATKGAEGHHRVLATPPAAAAANIGTAFGLAACYDDEGLLLDC